MASLTQGKIMHLVNQADYELLMSVKNNEFSRKEDLGEVSRSDEPDEVKAKQLNEKIMRDEKEKQFKENEEWQKVGKRLGNIIQPDSTVAEKNRQDLVEDVIDVLPQNFRTKGRQLVNRLMRQEGVKIDKDFLYINGVPMEHNVSDIVDQLVRPRKTLHMNLDTLIPYLFKVKFPKALIGNIEVLARLTPNYSTDSESSSENLASPRLYGTSTPKSSRHRKKKQKVTFETSDPSVYQDPVSSIRSPFVSIQEGNGGWISF